MNAPDRDSRGVVFSFLQRGEIAFIGIVAPRLRRSLGAFFMDYLYVAMFAAASGWLPALDFLLKYFPRVARQSHRLIASAASRDQLPAMRRLWSEIQLRRELFTADDITDGVNTALRCAAFNGKIAAMRLAVCYANPWQIQLDVDGALAAAAHKHHLGSITGDKQAAMTFAHELGASEYGRALRCAAATGNREAIMWLWRSITSMKNWVNDAVTAAIIYGQAEIVELLEKLAPNCHPWLTDVIKAGACEHKISLVMNKVLSRTQHAAINGDDATIRTLFRELLSASAMVDRRDGIAAASAPLLAHGAVGLDATVLSAAVDGGQFRLLRDSLDRKPYPEHVAAAFVAAAAVGDLDMLRYLRHRAGEILTKHTLDSMIARALEFQKLDVLVLLGVWAPAQFAERAPTLARGRWPEKVALLEKFIASELRDPTILAQTQREEAQRETEIASRVWLDMD